MCDCWRDHEWAEPRFIEAGMHQTMGRYQRFLVRCRKCSRATTETRWLDLPVSDRPDQDRLHGGGAT